MYFRVKVGEITCLRHNRGKYPKKSFFVSLDTLILILLYLEDTDRCVSNILARIIHANCTKNVLVRWANGNRMMEACFEIQPPLIKVWTFSGGMLNTSLFNGMFILKHKGSNFLLYFFFPEYLSNYVEYLQSNNSGLTGGNLIIQERAPAQYHPNFLCED